MSNPKNTTTPVEPITEATTVSAAALNAFEIKYSAWKASSDSTKSLNRELANIFDWRLYVSPRGKNKALALLTVKRYDAFTRKLNDILAKVRGESWTSKTDDARKKDLGGYISDWRLTALEQQDFDLFNATDGKLEFINLQKVDGEMKPSANKRAIADAAKKKAASGGSKKPQQPIAPVNDKQFVETALTLSNALHGYVSKYGKDITVAPSSVAVVIEQSLDCKETLQRILTDMPS
mgnify:CR=1 FL=1|tara:strand:- start:4692 stop:5399 length:708 start_codon:yes stop_codon:yes gene_type:complete